ncbi:TauD/TfdA family dioxygenase [Streptomyces albofaciens]|uniref:TauD/TfdA family dioxygenase n=1 Tax=Streptomyces albofaciens TaxID=66866 RepID=UPI00142EE35F|nr:TauD/TfdA family dioxygenase [Streptomyces albofaciens]
MQTLTDFYATVRYRSAEQCAEDVSAALSRTKVVRVSGVPEEVDHGAFYHGLASRLGDFHFKNEDARTASLESAGWLDIRYDPAAVDQSLYRYGNTRMPLHIDGAYTDVEFDIFFFYCVQQARFGGATVVADGSEVFDYLSVFDPGLFQQLLETEVLFEKGEKRRVSTILYYDQGIPSFNWSSTRVSAGNPPEVIEMARRFADFCEHQVVDGGLAKPVLLTPGEAVFMHNRRLLHGRNSFYGERCLLKGVLRFAPDAVTSGRADQVPAEAAR